VDLPTVEDAASLPGAQPEEELYCLFVLAQFVADNKNA
jgi:hypothetical protein